MPTETHASVTAYTYARSLLELAQERNVARKLGQELNQIREIIEANPTFAEFLRDPGIGTEERAGVIDRTIRAQADPLLVNFIGVLLVHDRLGILDQIAIAYNDLLDDLLGKVEVDVTVAQRLSPDELEQVRKKVADALKKDTVIHQYIDESIIGGLILKVEDKLIDASVKTQLETMRRQLLAAAPR